MIAWTSISEWTEGILASTTPILIYLTLFLFVFIETGILIAFFLPGDSVLFAAGFIAASRDDTSITVLVTVIFLAAFLGDQVGFGWDDISAVPISISTRRRGYAR